MPLGRGLSGSETKYIQALSPVALPTSALATAGNASLLGGEHNWMTLIVTAGSGTGQVVVQRSAASTTGFASTGLSISSDAAGLRIRSMPLNASPTWYRVTRRGVTGSPVTSVILELSQPRRTPVKQAALTTVHSTVLS